MSQYAVIAPTFWNGETGKKIRKKGTEAQVVALYLMSCPHRNALGLYYLPKVLLAHEVGLPLEGASKALLSLFEVGFCAYDEDSEVVWVYSMATFQIGEQLKKADHRVKWINEKYAELPKNPFLKEFYNKYVDVFHLEKPRESKPLTSPLQAPSKPDSDSDSDTDSDAETEGNSDVENSEPDNQGTSDPQTGVEDQDEFGSDTGAEQGCSNNSSANVPVKKIMGFWNNAVDVNGSTMPKLMAINPGTDRYIHVRARWKEYPDLDLWRQWIDKAVASDFLNGRCGSKPRPFSFDWIVKNAGNFTKVLEGKYDNDKSAGKVERTQYASQPPASQYEGLEEVLHV